MRMPVQSPTSQLCGFRSISRFPFFMTWNFGESSQDSGHVLTGAFFLGGGRGGVCCHSSLWVCTLI